MTSRGPDGRDAYAAAGVDYASIDPGKLLAQRVALGTSGALAARGFSEVPESRGESAYVIDLGDRYVSTVTEALGTKNLVADAVRGLIGSTRYDHIARDTVATILNDLATLGGAPLAVTAYWAAGRSDWFQDAERMRALVEGWGAACREAGCSWGGGETQVLPGMIDPGTVILGGSAVGTIAPKSRLLLGSLIQPGDAILVAPSTGIHANGLSLARSLADKLPRGYATLVPGDPAGRGYGEVLLDPSPLYGPIVEALQAAELDLHYAAHVTGHGWRKLMRADQPLTYVIEELPEVPPVFDLMTEVAGMGRAEAYGTFNMGAGYAFFIAEHHVEHAIARAGDLGRTLLRVGGVEKGPRRVVLRPLSVTFEAESLAIR
jgi:phosphoribosylformylglycinamidine cyclo-ligase